MDNIKSSHIEAKINNDFHTWFEEKYGSNNRGLTKVIRGKKHGYLAMFFDCMEVGKSWLDMVYYMRACWKNGH
jgi:hypothetical protein